jgi:nitric-oxide synthase
VAWRNSSRCIGRLYWKSLRIRDRRALSSAGQIAAEAVTHLREATNHGRIRPVITVFAPDAPGCPGPRILGSQLIKYAGYQHGDGTVTGDPSSAQLTTLTMERGWPGRRPRGRFDVLPLLIQGPGTQPTCTNCPATRCRRCRCATPSMAGSPS